MAVLFHRMQSLVQLAFASANIRDVFGAKKYPGQTARICDERQAPCDE